MLGRARRSNRRILKQYLSLQLLQLRRRVEPLLVREREPRRAVDLERLRLAAAAIERKHQLAAQPVAEWVGGDERFQLPDKLSVAAEQELGVEPILERDDAQLIEPRGFEPGELLLVEVCERRTVPQRERLVEQRNPLRRVRLSRIAEQAFEAICIDVFGFDREPVAGGLRDDEVAAEQLAERMDGVLERAGRGRGRSLAPEVGDEPVGGNDLSCPQCQRGEERPLLAAGESDDPVAVPHLERPEETYLHLLVVTPATNVSK